MIRDFLALLVHLMTTLATLVGSGWTKGVVAESLLLKHQLLIINRARRRAPNLCAVQRLLLGFWSLFLHPRRVLRCAVILKPSTLLRLHQSRFLDIPFGLDSINTAMPSLNHRHDSACSFREPFPSRRGRSTELKT
jgi:hypothetical protein